MLPGGGDASITPVDPTSTPMASPELMSTFEPVPTPVTSPGLMSTPEPSSAMLAEMPTENTDADITTTGRNGSLKPLCGLAFPSHVGSCLTTEEVKLGNMINDYRASVGKTRLPFSKTLSTVAQAHVFDSQMHMPENCNGNLHSWSGQCSTWSAVCFEFADGHGMWVKPSEINPQFSGNGFEISTLHFEGMTAERALAGWQGSPPHNDVIVENPPWTRPFAGMGIGIYGNYSHVWFAHSADPAGNIGSC